MEIKGLNYQYFCVHMHECVVTHNRNTESLNGLGSVGDLVKFNP